MRLQYVYPRLSRSVARLLLEELDGLDLAGVRATASSSHPAAAPVATGGQPVPPQVVERIAREVRSLAETMGYPSPLARSAVARFDQPCGDLLRDEMGIVPADAANEDVWSFMTLVVLPDIASWRFPDMLAERFLGLPRNTFRRLWWRSFTLQAANGIVHGGPEPLGEDELVNIFERSSLARSASVAQGMTRAIRSLRADGVARTAAMRELAKRMRRLVSFMAFEVLSQSDLDRLITAELDGVIQALTATGGGGALVPLLHAPHLPTAQPSQPHSAPARPQRETLSQRAPTATREESQERRRWEEANRRLEENRALIAKRTDASRTAAVMRYEARLTQNPPAQPAVPRRVSVRTDEDCVAALAAGQVVRFVQRSPSGIETISAELTPGDRYVSIRYTLRGHNAAAGSPRQYRHTISGEPAAAVAWLRNEHNEVIAGNRPAPIRNLREDLD